MTAAKLLRFASDAAFYIGEFWGNVGEGFALAADVIGDHPEARS
jgi:hypothetical protein